MTEKTPLPTPLKKPTAFTTAEKKEKVQMTLVHLSNYST